MLRTALMATPTGLYPPITLFLAVYSAVVLSFYTVIFLKLISYITVNKWCRETTGKKSRMKRQKSLSSIAPGTNNWNSRSRVYAVIPSLLFVPFIFFQPVKRRRRVSRMWNTLTISTWEVGMFDRISNSAILNSQ